MSRLKKDKTSGRQRKNMTALKGGSYSLVITVIVLAILIAVNMLSSVMPATMTKFDISSSRLYSITSNTKVVVNALQKDVTIYWIVQSDNPYRTGTYSRKLQQRCRRHNASYNLRLCIFKGGRLQPHNL